MRPGHWVALSVVAVMVLAVTLATCAQGVTRADIDDGAVVEDVVTVHEDGGVDAAMYQDADVQTDSAVQPDGAVTPDAGPACDPDPLPETAGAQCSSAIDLGVLSDVTGDLVYITGNSMPGGREIWMSFTASDDLDSSGDEFHVDIRFINNPNSAYLMDVFRGGCDAPNQIATAEDFNVDWYTDFPTTSVGCTGTPPCGEGDCVPSGGVGINACNDDTAVFYVRVARFDGLPSCDGFHLELSNGFY